MGTPIRGEVTSPALPAQIPTTGMRGGLGRTLLTAFLILTILPLALVGWYALQQDRANIQQQVAAKLQAVAQLKAQQIQLWFTDWQDRLLLLEVFELEVESVPDIAQWTRLQERIPELMGGVLLDSAGAPVWSAGNCPQVSTQALDMLLTTSGPQIAVDVPHTAQRWRFCLRDTALTPVIQEKIAFGQTGRVYLVQADTLWPGAFPVSEEVQGWWAVQVPRVAETYYNHVGEAVLGSYYPLPELGVGILVEQAQAETLQASDRIAATLIGSILTIALVTTAIAAVVIRQITRPVTRLTESALLMASGNLDQHVPVVSRDEIGILTYVFNEMAAELKSLYADLEAKVVDRTKMLQRANYQIQLRAIQLQASLEVSQAVTSLRDQALLLNRVADLVRDNFVYTSVAVYLQEPGGGAALLHGASPVKNMWPARVRLGDGTLMERALRKGEPQMESEQTAETVEWYRRTRSRVAIPLRMGDQVLGVLAVLSTEREGLQEQELKVLEHVANQVAIALENVRAYERERWVAQQLEEGEVFKARFLGNMSHELREPLNVIIGFSRLMLKGLDGPLNAQQQQDLQRINDSSQHLLALINDILTISQLQAGLMELKVLPVDLRGIIASVMPTASALVRGKEIALEQELAPDLPWVYADAGSVRQILVRLLSNAAKFTETGFIRIRAWADEEQVYVSISDSGQGISPEDCKRVFARFEKGASGNGKRPKPGAGLGLALSKELLEMQGGQIWFESEVGKGSVFTVSLRAYQQNGAEDATGREPRGGG